MSRANGSKTKAGLVAIWTFRKSISGDLMPSVGKEPYERSAPGNRRRPYPRTQDGIQPAFCDYYLVCIVINYYKSGRSTHSCNSFVYFQEVYT